MFYIETFFIFVYTSTNLEIGFQGMRRMQFMKNEDTCILPLLLYLTFIAWFHRGFNLYDFFRFRCPALLQINAKSVYVLPELPHLKTFPSV